jgi:hypothetical protein
VGKIAEAQRKMLASKYGMGRKGGAGKRKRRSEKEAMVQYERLQKAIDDALALREQFIRKRNFISGKAVRLIQNKEQKIQTGTFDERQEEQYNKAERELRREMLDSIESIRINKSNILALERELEKLKDYIEIDPDMMDTLAEYPGVDEPEIPEFVLPGEPEEEDTSWMEGLGRRVGGWNFSGRDWSPKVFAYNALMNGLTENYRSNITPQGVGQDVKRNIDQAIELAKNPNIEENSMAKIEGQASRYGGMNTVSSDDEDYDNDPNANAVGDNLAPPVPRPLQFIDTAVEYLIEEQEEIQDTINENDTQIQYFDGIINTYPPRVDLDNFVDARDNVVNANNELIQRMHQINDLLDRYALERQHRIQYEENQTAFWSNQLSGNGRGIDELGYQRLNKEMDNLNTQLEELEQRQFQTIQQIATLEANRTAKINAGTFDERQKRQYERAKEELHAEHILQKEYTDHTIRELILLLEYGLPTDEEKIEQDMIDALAEDDEVEGRGGSRRVGGLVNTPGRTAGDIEELIREYDDRIEQHTIELTTELHHADNAVEHREALLADLNSPDERERNLARTHLIELQRGLRNLQRRMDDRRNMLDRLTERRGELQNELQEILQGQIDRASTQINSRQLGRGRGGSRRRDIERMKERKERNAMGAEDRLRDRPEHIVRQAIERDQMGGEDTNVDPVVAMRPVARIGRRNLRRMVRDAPETVDDEDDDDDTMRYFRQMFGNGRYSISSPQYQPRRFL